MILSTRWGKKNWWREKAAKKKAAAAKAIAAAAKISQSNEDKVEVSQSTGEAIVEDYDDAPSAKSPFSGGGIAEAAAKAAAAKNKKKDSDNVPPSKSPFARGGTQRPADEGVSFTGHSGHEIHPAAGRRTAAVVM